METGGNARGPSSGLECRDVAQLPGGGGAETGRLLSYGSLESLGSSSLSSDEAGDDKPLLPVSWGRGGEGRGEGRGES